MMPKKSASDGGWSPSKLSNLGHLTEVADENRWTAGAAA